MVKDLRNLMRLIRKHEVVEILVGNPLAYVQAT